MYNPTKLYCIIFFFFFNDTATTEIYTLSLHDALPIQHALFRLTLGAVVRVDPRVAEPNRHARQRPRLPSRIQRDRHGRSSAERCKQQLVGSRAAIGPTRRDRFIGGQPMAPGGDLLRESRRAPAHRYHALLRLVDHGPPPIFM